MKGKMHYNEKPQTYKAFLASGVAGVISSTISAPFWTVKTRLNLYLMQYKGKTRPSVFSGKFMNLGFENIS